MATREKRLAQFDGLGAPPPEQIITHTNLYWSYQTAPGRTAATVDAAALEL